MRRGEIARAAGCTVSTLRHYEAVGLLPEPVRTSGGQRVYGEEHREILAFVLQGRAAGLTLEDIRDLLALARQKEGPCAEARLCLLRRQEALRNEIARLQEAERRLASMLGACAEAPADSGCVHLLPLMHPESRAGEAPARVAASRPAGVGVPAGPARPVGRVAQR